MHLEDILKYFLQDFSWPPDSIKAGHIIPCHFYICLAIWWFRASFSGYHVIPCGPYWMVGMPKSSIQEIYFPRCPNWANQRRPIWVIPEYLNLCVPRKNIENFIFSKKERKKEHILVRDIPDSPLRLAIHQASL